MEKSPPAVGKFRSAIVRIETRSPRRFRIPPASIRPGASWRVRHEYAISPAGSCGPAISETASCRVRAETAASLQDISTDVNTAARFQMNRIAATNIGIRYRKRIPKTAAPRSEAAEPAPFRFSIALPSIRLSSIAAALNPTALPSSGTLESCGRTISQSAGILSTAMTATSSGNHQPRVPTN